jgi:hypothetical protein
MESISDHMLSFTIVRKTAKNTNNMETKTESAENQLNETTTLLYVPTNVIGSVFKKLEDKDIQTEYLGIDVDGSGRIVLKVRSFDWQNPHLKKIISEMESDSAAITLFLTIIGEIAAHICTQYRSKEKETFIKYFKNNGSK